MFEPRQHRRLDHLHARTPVSQILHDLSLVLGVELPEHLLARSTLLPEHVLDVRYFGGLLRPFLAVGISKGTLLVLGHRSAVQTVLVD